MQNYASIFMFASFCFEHNFLGLCRNIWRELPEDKKSSFAYLESMWFYLYTTKLFKPKVLRWIKGLDIFSKKYVFVPIVLWYVFLICYLVMPKLHIMFLVVLCILRCYLSGIIGVF